MRKLISILALTCVTLLAPAPSAAQRAETVAGPVEFIGLVFSLAAALADSLDRRVPNGNPALYPEALIQMGFARARADRMRPGAGGSAEVTLITVVERSRANTLELRETFSPTQPLPPRWEPAALMFRDHNPSFLGAVTVRGMGGLAAVQSDPAVMLGADEIEEAGQALELLDVLDTGFDQGAAIRILGEDADPSARGLAAAILSGFAHDERAWRALLAGLLDSSASVNSFASQALGTLVAVGPIPVDWAESTDDVRTLLAGANLAGFPLALQVLVSTEVSPSLASAVLGGNAHLVLGHLASDASPHRDLAHRFLVQLRGEDLGTDPAAWRAWIEGL